MKRENIALTKQERDILILVAAHLNCNKLSNSEIALHLNIPVSRVKRLMHQAFRKLRVNNRIDAIRSAQRQGLISLNEFYSLDELAELLSALSPELLRKIASVVRRGSKDYILEDEERIIFAGRRQDMKLTNRERDVILCVGLGLTNKEIASRLYITSSAVATFLNRACRKLGANNRTDAFMIALKQREISVGELCSINDLIHILTPLGADTLEEIARRMDKKLGPLPPGNYSRAAHGEPVEP